ncbi:hypothetical protein BS47DRAFT_1338828, partial [Hydnum rufescens UP504]
MQYNSTQMLCMQGRNHPIETTIQVVLGACPSGSKETAQTSGSTGRGTCFITTDTKSGCRGGD